MEGVRAKSPFVSQDHRTNVDNDQMGTHMSYPLMFICSMSCACIWYLMMLLQGRHRASGFMPSGSVGPYQSPCVDRLSSERELKLEIQLRTAQATNAMLEAEIGNLAWDIKTCFGRRAQVHDNSCLLRK